LGRFADQWIKAIGMLMGPQKPVIRWASRLDLPVLGNQHFFEGGQIPSKLLRLGSIDRFLFQSLEDRACQS